MTNDEKMAILNAPPTESERALSAEARRLASLVPGMRVLSESLGRFPDEPHRFGFACQTARCEYEDDFSFYNVADLRRFVLGLAKRTMDDAAELARDLRARADEFTAETRACEKAITELEAQVAR